MSAPSDSSAQANGENADPKGKKRAHEEDDEDIDEELNSGFQRFVLGSPRLSS